MNQSFPLVSHYIYLICCFCQKAKICGSMISFRQIVCVCVREEGGDNRLQFEDILNYVKKKHDFPLNIMPQA